MFNSSSREYNTEINKKRRPRTLLSAFGNGLEDVCMHFLDENCICESCNVLVAANLTSKSSPFALVFSFVFLCCRHNWFSNISRKIRAPLEYRPRWFYSRWNHFRQHFSRYMRLENSARAKILLRNVRVRSRANLKTCRFAFCELYILRPRNHVCSYLASACLIRISIRYHGFCDD